MNYGLFLDLDHTHINPLNKRWIGSKTFWLSLHQSLQEKGHQHDLNVIPVIVTFRSDLGYEGRTMFHSLRDLFPSDPNTGRTYDIYELEGASGSPHENNDAIELKILPLHSITRHSREGGNLENI